MESPGHTAAGWLKPRLPASIVDLHVESRKVGFGIGHLRSAGHELGVTIEKRDGREFWLLPGQSISAQQLAARTPAGGRAQISPADARAECDRWAGILTCSETTGRELMAMRLCTHSAMSVEEARATLAAADPEGGEAAIVARIMSAGRPPRKTP